MPATRTSSASPSTAPGRWADSTRADRLCLPSLAMDRQKLRDGAAYADQWLAHQRAQREIPGTVVAIQHADQMLLLSAHGMANLERETAMTPRHIFRIASHSKTFTATSIMQLVERGRLRLDDPVSTHVPWLTSGATVRQTLNHVGGIIRDGLDTTFW